MKKPYDVMPVTASDPRELEKKLLPIAGAFLYRTNPREFVDYTKHENNRHSLH